ncbi:fumarylacetoacetate hydrolase family protein [Sphingomonas sp. QA11]|uniref:2-keto-4-pentenoate hydratase n=1 Tax=Sphingomonas sp. QA11 TaxID=2950605 RepID=UPI00234BAC9B|nr:fumarylacetoacetate hydrolase family protein [Sphingomonas sp. QA11]WCM26363.1 fumarylacetoacetate hydrolase family protein [Sphingomonas sp. QA11]
MGKEGPDAESGMRTARWRSIAERFVMARRNAHALAAYPGAVPQSLDEAYAIQTHAIALRGGRVGGWKIGRINPPADAHWRANRLAGPIFTDQIVEAPAGAPARMPVITAGFAAAEAEFLVRIGAAAEPGKDEWSFAEARALADRVAIGIEIASSPLTAINDLGAAVTASDFGNNYGLLVGPDLPDWDTTDLDSVPVSLSINGMPTGTGTTATMLDGPWGAVRFIAGHAARRGMPLMPGQWISTGAITGVHRVAAGDRVETIFGGTLLGCTIVAAEKSGR